MNVSGVPPWDTEHAWVPLPVAGGIIIIINTPGCLYQSQVVSSLSLEHS
jgi:hypothetical protein